jgi:hypothetical protein
MSQSVLHAFRHASSRLARTVAIALGLACMAVAPASAQSTTDAVAMFYYNLDSGMERTALDRFTGPARELLEAAQASEDACIDFSFVIDGQDYDAAEIERTLRVEEVPDTDPLIVTATFSLFGEPRSVEWTLVDQDGDFLISDVASGDGTWRLSEMSCE